MITNLKSIVNPPDTHFRRTKIKKFSILHKVTKPSQIEDQELARLGKNSQQ